ncbi:MAG: single-stranded-DNA-specific exonuclease RecJ [Fidelibacterota bacterium]
MRWNILTPDPETVLTVKKQFKTSAIIAKVLINRRIVTLEESQAFFKPDFSQLHDPFLMQDMDRAVDRIIKNILHKKPILIFGDYDVDGTTGTSLLYLGLLSIGARVKTYIPNRETEGYGLSLKGIDQAVQWGADLLVTCDCGINAVEAVRYARENRVEIIITDHHHPDNVLPEAFAILNPQREDCQYPNKGLCGCGVAFKLLTALSEKLNLDSELSFSFLDLVALATAADMVPILDENRVIVHFGLNRLAAAERPGIKYLLEQTGLLGKELNVGQLVFGLAPKINAAGRLGDANRTVELLTTLDENRARELAVILVAENQRRQTIQQGVVDEAIRLVNAEVDLARERAIVLAARGWHPGVLGIVASRIKEEFNRPSIVISIDEQGIGKGSARSVRGLDLYAALHSTSQFLEGFGGHPMAAGLIVREDRLDDFRRAFISVANEQLQPEDLVPSITIDGEMLLNDINPRFMQFLDKLGPYGPGNMRPKFVSRAVTVVGNPRLVGKGEHLRFAVRQEGRTYPAIGFGLSRFYEDLISAKPVDLAYVVETNEWQGSTSVQLNIRDIQLSDTSKE